jgi:PAS domain S-box-containing protein
MYEDSTEGQYFPVRVSRSRNFLWIAAVAVVYFGTARLSLSLVFKPEGIAAIWPPEGIFLAALLLSRRTLRPYLAGALFFTDAMAEMLTGTPVPVSLMYAFALTGDAAVSTWLLLRFVGAPINFRKIRDVVGFLLLSIILSNGLWSLVAAFASELLPGVLFWNSWKWWATSNGIGNLLVTPLILSWASFAATELRPWNAKRVLEGAALFIPLVFLSTIILKYFSENSQFSLLITYITFPYLLWAALRFGMRGVTIALFFVAASALHTTLGHLDIIPLFKTSAVDAAIGVQLYLAIMAVPSIFLAATVIERKRGEAALRESDDKMRTIIEGTPHLFFYTQDAEANTTYVSPTVERVTGYDVATWLKKKDWFITDAPLNRIATEKTRHHLRGEFDGKPVIVEVRHAAGNPILLEAYEYPIMLNGKIAGLRGVAHDITDRKRSEQLLSEEKERLSVTLRSIGDGVITTDMDGNVVLLNKAAEAMTGWKAEEAAHQPLPEVFTIVNELTQEPCENPVDKVLSTGSIVELANHTCLISKDGRRIIVADSGAPIRDNESRITGVVLVFRDMTEKQRLSDSMQRAQKLESLGILAGGIAHDFNNMLGGIFGYLDLAMESAVVQKTDQVVRYLNKALSVFDRAKGLTQQLLTFSKGGTPNRKTVEVAPLIQHSAAFALSGSNVSCQLDLAADLWSCDCDETQIGQTIDNIVINAKQAMPMGGKLIITAANVADAPGHPGDFIGISIKDEGIGMPKEILPKIFDPFFSTKTTGHGLGLATVYSIIQRHDGWIDVESTQGMGTTFRVFLPASHKNTPSGPATETTAHKGAGVILVMDDEEYIRETVGSMLQNMGYTVALAKDGREALALFCDAEKSGTPFAASILDMTIPGGASGKEIALAMRKINRHSIIVASSGYSEDPAMATPTEHGFSDRIIKPYRKKELSELMMRITSC